jgi:chromosome segregation ATPase
MQELEGENVRAESALRQKDEFANQLEDEIDRVKAEAERDREAADSKVNGLVQSLNSLTKQLEAADRKLAALDKEEIDERQLNQLTYEAWSDIVQYTEVLDKLLAPRLGRFAVPVRSVRQQLIGLRNVALKGRHAVSKRLRAR